MDTLRLYLKFVAIAVRSRMEYRSDFFVGGAGVLVLNAVNISLIYVIVSRFRSLGGWGFWEIALLYAMFMLSHCIYAVFFWHLNALEDDILSGRFDQYLIRPMSPLAQYLGREVNYMGVPDCVVGVAMFTLAYRSLGLAWSPGQWAFFALAVLAGTAIETSLHWMLGSLSFWVGRSRPLMGFLLQFQILVQQYPLEVFGRWYRLFVTGALPLAFMNYFPLSSLLGKGNALGLPALGYLSPAVGALLLGLGYWVWQRGLGAYTSSGS